MCGRSRAKPRGRAVVQEHGAATRLRPSGFPPITRKRYRPATMHISDMRHVVAAFDDRPRHSGGGCTLSKQTPRLAAVASPMGHEPPWRSLSNSRYSGSTTQLTKEPTMIMIDAAHDLVYNAFQHGDVSGLPEFFKRAKSRRAREIAAHVANFARLKSLYDRTPDGEADAICDEMEREENWFEAQLGF
jgi:hypothetical protein